VKIVFLETAQHDMGWFRQYYRSVFTAGKTNAGAHFKEAKRLLKSYPHVGHPSDTADFRELPILRTPFAIIYRIRGDEIQIVRLWDQRAERPPSWT
jgi:ParE toxin of type II toxin-antitoxin system, parDE